MLVLTQLCGLPGAGKSTYAAQLPAVVLTADDIRTGADATRTMLVLWKRVDKRLREGQSIVIDTCGLQTSARRRALAAGRRHGARCELVVLPTPVAECMRRNAARADPAPLTPELQRQFAALRTLVMHEGWDSVTWAGRGNP